MSTSVTPGRLTAPCAHGDEVSIAASWQGAAAMTTLFDLPLFVREQIYDYIFEAGPVMLCVWKESDFFCHPGDRERDSSGPNDHWFAKRTLCLTLAIAQTCRLTRAEALPRFYKMTSIGFDCRDDLDVSLDVEELGQVLENKNLLGKIKKRRKKMDMTGRQVQAATCRDRKEEAIAALRAHREIIRPVMKHVRHLAIDCFHLPAIGWDVESLRWTDCFYEMFPKLEWLGIHFWVSTCECATEPIIQYVVDDLNERLEYQHRIEPPGISDGEFLRRIWSSTRPKIELTFGIEFDKGCSRSKRIIITLDPDREPDYDEVGDMLNRVSDLLGGVTEMSRILRDFGLHRQVDEYMRRFRTNRANIRD